MVSDNVIVAVCRAHGDSPEWLRRETTDPKGNLKYQRSISVDPLFCAILLRLADILDFDDSRAPSVLFSYSGNNSKSVEEWKKHKSSMGFNYPDMPSSKELPYGARFSDPTIERAVNKFLDWIDEELSNSRSLLLLTNERWNQFVFPYQVDRSEIDRVGYDYGDFKITMDQDKILELLVGENLYSDPSVFVRELLQNSIDATLTRAEMDSTFAEKINTDEARIDLWEWWDDEGNLWFRIDDFGTGMTRGMLEKYFLKAGNSYYNSKEFKNDLNGKSFKSISRFGIGFLSCFLCGVEAYVSTKYWNSEKNIREAERNAEMRIEQNKYGLRLDVVGLNEYYTLKNQAIIDNRPDPLPTPPITCPHPDDKFENDGYRVLPGTSIAIRIDPGKLGATSLLRNVKRWACYPRMPIYYNGKRLCMTHNELVSLAKAEQGVIEYELSDEEKQRIDVFLPEYKGKYPKIREIVDLFEADQIPGLPNLKIVLLATEVLIPSKHFYRNNRLYHCNGKSILHKPRICIENVGGDEEDLSISFQSKDKRQLLEILSNYDGQFFINYGWKGVLASQDRGSYYEQNATIIILDEDEERPSMKANRELDVSIPLKTSLTIIAWIIKNYPKCNYFFYYLTRSFNAPLSKWREIVSSSLGDWIDVTTLDSYISIKAALEQGFSSLKDVPKELKKHSEVYWKSYSGNGCINSYFLAYMLIHYRIVVNYSKNKLAFYECDSTEAEKPFDLFPVLPFCYGETAEDCSILCYANPDFRFAITANHPFAIWLLKNAKKLHQYYPRQFDQINSILRNGDSYELTNDLNGIIEQLSNTANRYGIDTSTCPKITLNDFKIE